MSELDGAVKASETPVDGSEGIPGMDTAEKASDGSEGQSEAKAMSKEMRYRLERNAAREGLAAAEQRIESLQKAAIENLAGVALAKPGDLFTLSGKSVADYVDESGHVVADLVRADIAEILRDRPAMKRLDPAHDPSQATGGTPQQHAPRWGELFR